MRASKRSQRANTYIRQQKKKSEPAKETTYPQEAPFHARYSPQPLSPRSKIGPGGMLAAEDIQLKRIKSHLTALQPRDLRDAPRPAIKSCRPNPRDSFVIGRQRRNVGDFGAPGGRSRRWETGTSGETGTKERGREKERESVWREEAREK